MNNPTPAERTQATAAAEDTDTDRLCETMKRIPGGRVLAVAPSPGDPHRTTAALEVEHALMHAAHSLPSSDVVLAEGIP